MGLGLAGVPHRAGGVQAAMECLAADHRSALPKRESTGAKVASGS
jgi:hypothetical protein